MGYSLGTAYLSLEHMQAVHQRKVLDAVPPCVLEAVIGGGPAVYLASRQGGQGLEFGFGRVVERVDPLLARFVRHDGEERQLPLVALSPITEADYKRVTEDAGGDPRKAFGMELTTLQQAHQFIQYLTQRWATSA